mgnify:FL=1
MSNFKTNEIGSFIWLHGLGSSSGDSENLVRALKLNHASMFSLTLPDATLISVTINGGEKMPAWYDIKGTELTDRQDKIGIEQSGKIIKKLIVDEVERGINPERIFLGGFSQGGAMALHVGTRLDFPIAGVVCLSGYLPVAEAFEKDFVRATRETPFFIAHGLSDHVVRAEWTKSSTEILRAKGFTVTEREYANLGHSVSQEEIDDLSSFLNSKCKSI